MTTLPNATDSRQATPGQTEQATTFSLAEVMDLPLGQIISRLRVRVYTAEITDPEFYGGLHLANGRITIFTSPGRDKFVTECMIRYLTAQALGHDVTPLPMPFEVEFTDFTERARETVRKAVTR